MHSVFFHLTTPPLPFTTPNLPPPSFFPPSAPPRNGRGGLPGARGNRGKQRKDGTPSRAPRPPLGPSRAYFFTRFAANRPTFGSLPTIGAAYFTNAGVTSHPFFAIHASGMLRVFLATFRNSTRSNLTL